MPDLRPPPGSDLSKLRNLKDTRVVLQRGATYQASSDWGLKRNVEVVAEGTGGPRPRVDFLDSGAGVHLLGAQNIAVSDVALICVHPQPSSGGVRSVSSKDVRLTRVEVAGFRNGMTSEGKPGERSSNFTVEQCYVHNNFNAKPPTGSPHGGGHSQGIFTSYTDGLRLLRTVWDTNGWTPGKGIATQFNHNAYLNASCGPAEVVGNLFYNGAATGLQHRCGGPNSYNLFLNNPIGLTYGLVNGGGPLCQGGVSGDVHHLVFVGGRDINGSPRGNAMSFANCKRVRVRDVLIAHAPQDKFQAVALERCRMGADSEYLNKPGGIDIGIADLEFDRVYVWDWPKGEWIQSIGGQDVKRLVKPQSWAPPKRPDLREWIEERGVLANARASYATFDAKPLIDQMFALAGAGQAPTPTPTPPPPPTPQPTPPSEPRLDLIAVKLDGKPVGRLQGSSLHSPVAVKAVPVLPGGRGIDRVHFSLDKLGDEKPPLLEKEERTPPYAFPGDTGGDRFTKFPWTSGAYRMVARGYAGTKEVVKQVAEFSVCTDEEVAAALAAKDD